jgi:hypothetical protein
MEEVRDIMAMDEEDDYISRPKRRYSIEAPKMMNARI